jgi:ribosomal protein S18 acetylase RimI-like enzyme
MRPEYRGRSLGVALLKQLARYAIVKDFCRMEGHVFAWNDAAIRFYESLGCVLRPDLIQVRLERANLEKFIDF